MASSGSFLSNVKCPGDDKADACGALKRVRTFSNLALIAPLFPTRSMFQLEKFDILTASCCCYRERNKLFHLWRPSIQGRALLESPSRKKIQTLAALLLLLLSFRLPYAIGPYCYCPIHFIFLVYT